MKIHDVLQALYDRRVQGESIQIERSNGTKRVRVLFWQPYHAMIEMETRLVMDLGETLRGEEAKPVVFMWFGSVPYWDARAGNVMPAGTFRELTEWQDLLGLLDNLRWMRVGMDDKMTTDDIVRVIPNPADKPHVQRVYSPPEVARLIKDADAMRGILRQLTSSFAYPREVWQTAVHEITRSDITLNSLPPGNAWWEVTEDQALRRWLNGEISEGVASYLLGVDRIVARERASNYAKRHGLEDNRYA